jgi:KDO2-lipid IV(A) lauroyltransferase
MSRIVFGLMWLAHFLPLAALAAVGNAVGMLVFVLVGERRRVTRINLGLCFPAMPAAEREELARAHFRAFCRAFVERCILWWGSRGRIAALVRLEGLEHLDAVRGSPVIVFAPHFVGLDQTLARLSLDREVAMMYSKQKDPLFDALLYRGRTRFGCARMFPRQAGVEAAFKAIAEGALYYYLPDLDYGPRHAAFVPFFGVPAATVTGLSFMAKRSGARVVPCVTHLLPGSQGYVARFHPAWDGFPSADPVADTRRMNAFIEARVLEAPEQYFWMHKRFKTRPPGEAGYYQAA